MASVTEQKPEVNTGITVSFNKQDDTHYQAASSDGETWYDYDNQSHHRGDHLQMPRQSRVQAYPQSALAAGRRRLASVR
jgi:hypothetical protein